MSAQDDARVRESHGCACLNGEVKLAEREDGIRIQADYNAVIKPRHARYLARKLYHLASKIERRAKATAASDPSRSSIPNPRAEAVAGEITQ